jgi:hypothetical protein
VTAEPGNQGGGRVLAELSGGYLRGRTPQTVGLREGDVIRVGRLDKKWLARSGLEDRYVALGPTTRMTVPAVSLTIVVGRETIEVRSGSRPADATVDGVPIGPEGCRLAGPRHEIVIDPSGVPQRLILVFVSPAGTAAIPAPHSGSTIVPVLEFASRRLLQMAAAVAWPLLSDLAPSLNAGWSTAAVAARHRELWGHAPGNRRRVLFDLREMLVNARCSDGRPMAAIAEVQPWPWPADLGATRFLSEVEFTEDKNRQLAVYLATSAQVRQEVARALDRNR